VNPKYILKYKFHFPFISNASIYDTFFTFFSIYFHAKLSGFKWKLTKNEKNHFINYISLPLECEKNHKEIEVVDNDGLTFLL